MSEETALRVLVRDWAWDLEKGGSFLFGSDTTATYLIANKSAEVESVDQKFINDKYWLLFPFQLAWDNGYEPEKSLKSKFPHKW